MAQLILRLFGHPHLERNGQTIDITSRKGMALLAHLAAADPGHAQGRDRLATLLWPDYDQTRARANLRRTLYTLNKSDVSNWIEAAPEQLELRPEDGGWIDAVRFASLQAHVAEHDHDDVAACDPCLLALQKAVSLYDGDFLADFYLADSIPFEEWAEVARDKYRRQALEAMHTLAGAHLAQGEFATAEQLARRQLEIDNLREDAWRQLLQVLALSGRRSVALAEYESLRHLLQEELGVAPAPATEELVEAIRAGALSAGWEEPTAAPQPVTPQRPSAPPPPVSEPASPYRGLFAFREEHAPLFFGREAFTEQLLEAAAEQAAVAIIGPSGSGKSSVLFAGLIADLRPREEWLIASFRPGSRPLRALATALIPLLEPDLSETERLVEARKLAQALADGELTLDDVVNRLLAKHEGNGLPARLLLAADQFEELYTLCPDVQQRRRFLAALLPAVFEQQFRATPRFTLALTLRADFVPQALAYRPLADALREADVKLGPMMRAEVARAVERPPALQGVTFEPGLVTRILDDVGEEPGNLPLLQFALTAMWERRDETRLTHAAYEEIGRVDGAVAGYAEEVYRSLTPEAQAAARRIFIQVVRPGEGTEDTRRLATRRELAADDWPVVQRLADARLLVTGRDVAGEQETVEVVHEALIGGWDRLRRWMAADREFRVWQERLRAALDQWQASDRDEGALLRGVPLATAEQWLRERPDDLSEREKEFVRESIAVRTRREEERRQRQRARERLRRRIFAGLGIGFILALLLLAVAVFQWNAASRSADESHSLALAANAQTALDGGNGDLALALALEAVGMENPPQEAQRALTEVVLAPGTRFVLEGHKAPVNTFAFTADGHYILSGSGRTALAQPIAADNSLRLWDLETGEEVRRFEGHTDAVRDLVVSPDGDSAVSASWDGSLIVWDLQSGQPRVRFDGHPGSVEQVSLLPDGRRALSLALAFDEEGIPRSSSLILWNVETGEEMHRFEPPSQFIAQFDLTSDGELALLGVIEPEFKLLNLPVGQAALVLWRVSDWREVRRIPVEGFAAAGVSGIKIGPDDRVAAAAVSGFREEMGSSITTSGLLLDLASGDVRHRKQFSGSGVVSKPAFSPDGALIAVSTDVMNILFDRDTGEEIRRFGGPGAGHTAEIRDKLFSPDGKTLLTGGGDSILIRWDVETGAVLQRLAGHRAPISKLALAPDGQRLLSASEDGTLRLWNFTPEVNARRFLEHDFERATYVALDPDGPFALSSAVTGSGGIPEAAELILWDLEAGERVYAAKFPGVGLRSIAFLPDGRRALLGGLIPDTGPSGSGLLVEWDVEAGEEIRRIRLAESGEIWHLAASPNGRVALLGTQEDAFVRVWDLEAGKEIRRLEGHTQGPVFGVAMGSNGRRGLSGGADGLAILWNLESGELVRKFDHGGWVTSVTFTPDEKRFVSTSTDNSIVLWDLETGEAIRRFVGHSQGVSSAVFTPDGRQLISSSADGTLILWDVETGRQMRTFTEHENWVWRVVLTPDGTQALSAAQDGLVIMRSIAGFSLEQLIDSARRNRHIPEFTCDQRTQYHIEPLCESGED